MPWNHQKIFSDHGQKSGAENDSNINNDDKDVCNKDDQRHIWKKNILVMHLNGLP